MWLKKVIIIGFVPSWADTKYQIKKVIKLGEVRLKRFYCTLVGKSNLPTHMYDRVAHLSYIGSDITCAKGLPMYLIGHLYSPLHPNTNVECAHPPSSVYV